MSRRRSGGKLFHTRGPAALKLRSPKLLCVRGTRHVLAAAERSWRRSLSVVGYVCGCLTSQRLEYQVCNIVFDSLTDRQPMQLTQHRRDVVTSSSFCDQTWSGVLNGLNLPQKAVWHAVQHGVAVVQTTADKRLDCCFGGGGSVATHCRCGGKYDTDLVANLLLSLTVKEFQQDLSDRKQIARQLRTQYVQGIYRPNYPVTLKSNLTVT